MTMRFIAAPIMALCAAIVGPQLARADVNDNIAPHDCSGSITTGGTAQVAIAASPLIHGFTIGNTDAVTGSGEPMGMSFTTTAAYTGSGATLVYSAGTYPLPAPTATTQASMGSYTSPFGAGFNHEVSVIAATTGHKFTCTYW